MRTRARSAAILATALVALAAASGSASAAQANCPWMKDANATPDARAHQLLAAMSTDQKISRLTYSLPPWFTYFGTAGHLDGIPALCIPTLNLSDAGSGVVGLQIQTTVFPSGVAQASAFDPVLQRRFGKAVGEEAFNKGINVMLGPGMNIARTPLNGRNFEYFGEDPFLAASTATAVIEGIQSQPVMATAKHYALNNQETDRNTVDSIAGERTMREIYLPAFEAAVRNAKAGAVMCAYNKVNGPYACENKELLNGFLRRDWGFDGLVMSDWGAVHSTVPSVLSGLDLEMNAAGTQYYAPAAVKSALAGGKITPGELDDMVLDILRPMFRIGLFDHPVTAEPVPFLNAVSTPAHKAIADELAAAGTVLLKNKDNLLPLTGHGKTIAVIGFGANPAFAPNASGGGGSSRGLGFPTDTVSPLQGILTAALAHGDHVLYADGSLEADATAVAKLADVAVVVATDSLSEGADRPDLGFRPGICVTLICETVPLEQDGMIAAAAAANPNTVAVLDVGAPVAMPWLDKVRAVLLPWYSGIENGTALAAMLYGESAPSGRLPQTFPRSVKDLPTTSKAQYPGVGLKADYSEGLLVGYRWFEQKKIAPLFPFGYGLTYTTFSYSHLDVNRTRHGADVRFTLHNTGKRDGAEVGQVYVGFPRAAGEPPRQLKGFKKVALSPGDRSRIRIALDRRAFSIWDTARHGWHVVPGCYRVMVGASSSDIRLTGRVPLGMINHKHATCPD